MINFPITSNQKLSTAVQEIGIQDLEGLLKYLRQLPYGRNSNRTDLELVLKEQKGTCSSKHAFVKQIAEEAGEEGLELIIGLYKMTLKNTPGIGNGIEESGLSYIPEAHCYLKWQDERLDITNSKSNFERIQNDILEEKPIESKQVGEYKVHYHQDYLKKWITIESVPLDFETVWKIRESCIRALSNRSNN